MPTAPLRGVRVLDLGIIWAGPYGAMLLADQGAEVIKVESPRAVDPNRVLTPPLPNHGEHWWNLSCYFHEYSRNKKSVTLDLAQERGRELLGRLVALSDVVVENYRADAMDKLGLTYDWFRSQREDIIVVGMAAFGKSGPERPLGGYGLVIEAAAGLAALTGYPDDGHPYPASYAYGDPVAGAMAAAAILAALIHRQRYGRGQYIDLAQREALTACQGEAFVEYAVTGRQPPQRGNEHAWLAPHNAYPCAGENNWVTIAVTSDAQWDALCAAMERPAWAADAQYATDRGRWERREEIDARITEWTRARSMQEVFDRCRAHRVPAGPVYDARDLLHDPHLRARGFYTEIRHPEAPPWLTRGHVWRESGAGGASVRQAPDYDEHNREVLSGLLDLSEAEIAALQAEGVIVEAPPGIPLSSELRARAGR